ncbi:HD-GYP domain-containing protein [Clostridium magnum]|uniref:Cyclic di-GMP phosphodiesterase response regulator RpfG n=1 Tax=Clostridium magnum DSM 2767 TaxID=1121326 RepID=A0A161X0F8_9CLOT|nr:HD-GYP domain-containing protein [Clostridium magnum]KZL92908.1 cyclic di-GMP phosphodiesterase response regulator RpfG [Clostridium magnum DSM 2767]SHJ15885.1 HDIG domain-containing protein [Clostridium magnum DSM 2767]
MRSLKLLRYFTIYSLIAFIFTGVAIVLLITTHIKNDKINSIEQVTHLAIHYIIEPELSSSDYSQALSKEKSEILDNKFKHTLEENNILEAVIWNNSKTIIYSSNKNITEIQPTNQKIFNQVLGGKYSYFITDLQHENRVIKIIKIYIPITVNNSIVGIYEILKPYDEIQMHMNQVTKISIIVVSSGFVILYLLLLKIIYNSSIMLLKQNKELTKNADDIKLAYSKLNMTYKSTILVISKAIDARDQYTAGHSERVAKISLAIVQSLNLPKEQLETLELAALFHDVGKIGIPDYILNKPGRLTDEEFNKIKEHPSIGVDILKTIDFLSQVLPIILHHHERFDGGGYPNGVKGENIPFESRIICVADSYDAMTSNRPYRNGLPHEVAVSELIKYKNIQFDSNIVDAFLQVDIKTLFKS